MLKTGELTPYFKLPSLDDEPYNLWDFRQRKNLVLVFLPSPEQEPVLHLMVGLRREYKAYRELSTEIMVLAYQQAGPARGGDYPFAILLDTGGKAASRYLGSEAVTAGKFGVFVLDRYGELWQQWLCSDAADLPEQKELLDTLYLIERQCPE